MANLKFTIDKVENEGVAIHFDGNIPDLATCLVIIGKTRTDLRAAVIVAASFMQTEVFEKEKTPEFIDLLKTAEA